MPWLFVRSSFRSSGTLEVPEKVSTRIRQRNKPLRTLREHVICLASGTNGTSGKPWKLPLDAESSLYSALTGDDFSPGTTEFQQLAMVKPWDFSKWLKKNAGKRPGACGFQECEPVSVRRSPGLPNCLSASTSLRSDVRIARRECRSSLCKFRQAAPWLRRFRRSD